MALFAFLGRVLLAKSNIRPSEIEKSYSHTNKIAPSFIHPLVESETVGVLRPDWTIGDRRKRENKRERHSTHIALTERSVFAVLKTGDITDSRVLRFWLLLLGGLMVFFAWTLLFSWYAKVWGTNNPPLETTSDITTGVVHDFDEVDYLVCVDIWFALGLMAAIDAFTIVINFDRSLIHQFHYFVSLRMMLVAFIISAAIGLLYNASHEESLTAPNFVGILALACIFYKMSTFMMETLHTLLPIRGIGRTRGSLQKFSEKLCLFDIPWLRAITFATINGAVGFALTAFVPARWSVLNPVIHITWEVTYLGLMGTKQTPRYIWFATPVVQASTCTDWGLRQVAAAPRLVLPPWAFLTIMLAGRLILDIYLCTVFAHRFDFQWARTEVLLPTRALLVSFGVLWLIECIGIPVVTFIKVLSVVILHTFGVLVFLLPASYGLAFDKTGIIRG